MCPSMARSWSVRTGGLEAEEEEAFFDSQEELPPASTAGAALPWQGALHSVRERRERFIRAMGLECSPSHRVGCCGDVDEHEVREIGQLSFSVENDSDLSASSWSSSEEDTSSGDGGASDDNSVGGGSSKDGDHEVGKSLASLSFIQRLLRGDGKPPSDASKKVGRRRRHGWLRRIAMGACTPVDHGSDEASTSSSECGHGDGGRCERIKVRTYRKQVKEFSAVYRGQAIKAHDGAIPTMEFSPDGELLATGGEDGVVRVWRVTQAEVCDIPTDDASCVYLKMGEESQLAHVKKCKVKGMKRCSESACVVLPELVFRIAEKPLHEFRGHSGDVLDMSWSSSKCLLSASTDKTVRLWEIGCANCIAVFHHSNFVTCVQVNPAIENCFISGSIDGKIRVWDIARCRVLDWADVRQIITAVCYHPDGNGAVVGTIDGNCHFYNTSDNLLQLESLVKLNGKKKSSLKRITGLQFCPTDPRKLMVTSADSKIKILDGVDVIEKYSGLQRGSCQFSATFTPDGRYIISASEGSHIYIWNNEKQETPKQAKTTWTSERFPASNATIAIPWNGKKPTSPAPFASENNELFRESSCKSAATWPEEMLPNCSTGTALDESQCKFLRNSCQSDSRSWGQVIVSAGLDGWIRSFQNYGLPVQQ